MKKSRRVKIPEEAYQDGPDGLKIYDVKLGSGALVTVRAATVGSTLSRPLCLRPFNCAQE